MDHVQAAETALLVALDATFKAEDAGQLLPADANALRGSIRDGLNRIAIALINGVTS
jgi:predicted lipoprotein